MVGFDVEVGLAGVADAVDTVDDAVVVEVGCHLFECAYADAVDYLDCVRGVG